MATVLKTRVGTRRVLIRPTSFKGEAGWWQVEISTDDGTMREIEVHPLLSTALSRGLWLAGAK